VALEFDWILSQSDSNEFSVDFIYSNTCISTTVSIAPSTLEPAMKL
jgi:hypothetical protein